MANQITRDIYVLRKSIIEPIHYVRLTNAVDIVFNMRDYEIPSGAVAAVYAQKPDGTAVYSNATISENTVTVEMTTQMVAVLGVGHLQVRIQSGSNSADVLCSFVVPLIVEPNFTEGDFPPSKNENGFFGDVEEHLQQVESDITTMKEEWTEFQSDITQQVQEIQEEQTTQGSEITDLQKKVAKLDEEKSPALVLDASGSWVTVEDSGDSAANGLTIHGKSTQVVTTGAQLIDFSKSSFNYCSLENANTGTLKSNITDFYFGFIRITYLNEYMLSKRGETITFSTIDGVPEKKMSIVIFGTRANGTTYQEKYSTLGENLVSLTVAQDFETITSVELRFNRSSSKFTDTNTLVTGVMLNTGNTAIPFEPYTGGAPSPSPDYPQEITSVGDGGSVEVVSTGAQIFDESLLGTTEQNGCKVTNNGDGSFTVSSSLEEINEAFGFYIDIPHDKMIKMLRPGNLTLDLGAISYPYFYVSIRNDDLEVLYELNGYNKKTNSISIPEEALKREDVTMRFGFYGAQGIKISSATVKPMLYQLGDGTWRPYQSSTATFSTPNGLPGIPVDSGGNYIDADGQQWICDEIDTKAGVYRKRVGKITFDGGENEEWLPYKDATFNGFMILEPNMKSGNRSDGMCDRFTIDKNNSSETYGIWLGSDNQYVYFHNCNPSIASSTEEWRTWLSTHSVTLIYPLETPVETPLSDAELIEAGNLRTFATTTNITTEDPVDPEITLEYAADLKTYIDKRLAEISAATLENATTASQ